MSIAEASPIAILAVTAGRTTAAALDAALAAAEVVSVIITVAPGVADAAALVEPLVAAAQTQGAAALIVDDWRLAAAVGADGVHLTSLLDVVDRLREARRELGAKASIGADAGASRHTAMELGEAGADYVAFAIGASLELPEDGIEGPRQGLDLIAWWADVFEPPVVAVGVLTPAEAREAFRAGADFVALTLPPDLAPAAAVALATAFEAALRHADVIV